MTHVEHATSRVDQRTTDASRYFERHSARDPLMASTALRGDVVYTTDVSDLEALRAHFSSVRVLGV